MVMKILFVLLSLTLLPFSVTSFGSEDEVKPLSKNLRGEVHFSWFVFDVYHAKLWAENKIPIYSKPFTLELIYKRELKGKDIADRSITELSEQGVKRDVLDHWQVRLRLIFPDIKKGDRIFANFNPEEGIDFYLNAKQKIGVIKDKDFSVIFMNIWLGDKTSEQDMRTKLLGDLL
jgi:hypothetical protein